MQAPGSDHNVARERQLHWFWRGAIAVGVGVGFSTALNVLLVYCLPLWAFASTPVQLSLPFSRAGVAVVAYGLLTRWFAPPCVHDRETRCRNCTYILRGITEPRCPECGERI